MSIKDTILESIKTKELFLSDETNLLLIEECADICINTLLNGGKVLLCGNGGSASDAQHIAAELSGRFNYDRPPLFAEALHVNTSFVTAVANDYSYDDIYKRMVQAAGREGDVLIGLTTSGNSNNVVKAVEEAKNLNMHTIGFTGRTGGKLVSLADKCIRVPSDNTARVQETHILVGHIICEIVESTIFPKEKAHDK